MPPHWKEALPQLSEAVRRPNFGIITDVDGTLSPIVPNPDDARISPRSRELLAALQAVLPLVAVVSGRAAADVHGRVDVPGLAVVGNHGLEEWVDGEVRVVPEIQTFRPALVAAIAVLEPLLEPGMRLEDKGATLSVHYRQVEKPDETAERFQPVALAAAEENGQRLFHGRRVFELRPPIDVDKGSALRRLIAANALDSALFMGDDTTDVDALIAARELREDGVCYALGVGVESDGTPELVLEAADMLVSGVSGVEGLLGWVLNARRASST